jgi:hypothetical protein
MTRRLPLLLAGLAAAATPSLLAAQQPARAAFVTLLGNDTIAVERMSRTANELRAEVLLRSPRTTLTVYRMALGPDGRPTSLEATSHDPAAGPASPATSREVVRWAGDSLRIERTGGENTGSAAVAGGAAVLPFIDMVHWPYELVLERAHAATADSVLQPLLTGRRTSDFVVRRTGANAYSITHPFRGTMTTTTDAEGRLVSLDAGQTTRALTVMRVAEVPFEALVRDFAARGPVGELSGRGAAEAVIGGATIELDYGVPKKRGREIFGALVAYDRVWRTGANRATHLTTDRDLVIGGTPVPAGSYTLFSIPRADGWTLIINKQTNINGTAHDPAHDLARIEMQTRTLPEAVENFTIKIDPEGQDRGVLRLQWDRTEASVEVRRM